MRPGTFCVPYRLRVVAVAAALFALTGSGCDEGARESAHSGSTGADEPVPVDVGVLELGSFSEARTFTPYAGGEEEPIEMGLQGGFHIFVDGRLRPDAELSEVVVELGVSLVADGSEVTRIRHQRTPDIPDASGWPTLPEMIIFIPDPTVVDGQDVRIDVQLETVDGELLDVLDAQLYLSRSD
ncbi:MAG: hypothetical protein KUG77_14965 [Nannocystaceae bacterium]|nr:hypothetical protein [Nannocystaceae bacterium]